jgi:RNA polymerase primary sigma factor
MKKTVESVAEVIREAKTRRRKRDFSCFPPVLNSGKTEEQLVEQRTRLKQLISIGKSRRYITESEVKDYLARDVISANEWETIIQVFHDMNIEIRDK